MAQEDTIVNDITIYTDSQAAISCINNHSQGASAQLLKETCEAIRTARKGSGGTPIQLQWCPGHASIPGNKAADLEASRVAVGHTYPAHLIPQVLADYHPPLNPTTCKKAMMAVNRLLAEAHWTASNAHVKFAAKYPSISLRHFLAHLHTLTRSKAMLLFRLTAGHIQLKQHLYRLQLVDSPRCDHYRCDSETVTHFLFCCPYYATQRWEHLASRGPDYLRPAFLLHASCTLEPLFDYVKATGHFPDLVH
ncbi:reverse transcriptase from transposon X-element protein, putative, partial [Rhizoctonia solani AG-3 Rhs1AP]